MQDQGSKIAHVRLTMTMSTKVRIPFLLNIMSIHQWEKLNVFEKNTCSCFHPMWKPTSHTMAANVS